MLLTTPRPALLALILLLLAPLVQAQPVGKEQVETLRKALEPALGLKIGEVRAAELPGMYMVELIGGPQVYATADGKHFLAGDLFEVSGGDYTNLTEQFRVAERKKLLDAIPQDQMIVFAAKGERRAYIDVFTDTTCGYCRKLHLEVPELNAQGVEVRYLAYPRGGPNSPGFNQLATAWCDDDPPRALTRLKAGENLPNNVCKDNPVEAQYQLSQQLGLRGTPAIILEDGTMVPGFKPAAALLADLKLAPLATQAAKPAAD